MNLYELLKLHGFGNGQRYRHSLWSSEMWLEPLFVTRDQSYVVGHAGNGSYAAAGLTSTGWKLVLGAGIRKLKEVKDVSTT